MTPTQILQQCKDEVAKNNRHGFDDWQHFIDCYNTYDEYEYLLDELTNEAAMLFAQKMCEDLASNIINVLETQSFKGCRPENKTWMNYQNGAGEDIGHLFHSLIDRAKSTLTELLATEE